MGFIPFIETCARLMLPILGFFQSGLDRLLKNEKLSIWEFDLKRLIRSLVKTEHFWLVIKHPNRDRMLAAIVKSESSNSPAMISAIAGP